MPQTFIIECPKCGKKLFFFLKNGKIDIDTICIECDTVLHINFSVDFTILRSGKGL